MNYTGEIGTTLDFYIYLDPELHQLQNYSKQFLKTQIFDSVDGWLDFLQSYLQTMQESEFWAFGVY